MNLQAYQRQIVAYHGCERRTFEAVMLQSKRLEPSAKPWDWLGKGIYFWEHGPERAYQWAVEKAGRGEIDEPAVLGAVIHLGRCFDLLDTRYTELLATAYPDLEASLAAAGRQIPRNEPRGPSDSDVLRRRLDCFVLNWVLDRLASEDSGSAFDSVRGMFREGGECFPGSRIHLKSHIQIAVRNPHCILGYFAPHSAHQ